MVRRRHRCHRSYTAVPDTCCIAGSNRRRCRSAGFNRKPIFHCSPLSRTSSQRHPLQITVRAFSRSSGKNQNGYRLRLLLGCVATLHDTFNLFTHSPSLTCVQHVLSALLSFTTLDSLSSTVFMSFVSACLLSHFLMSCCKSTDKLSD